MALMSLKTSQTLFGLLGSVPKNRHIWPHVPSPASSRILPRSGIRIKYPETKMMGISSRQISFHISEAKEHTIPVLGRRCATRAERDNFYVISVPPPGARSRSCFRSRSRFLKHLKRSGTQNLLVELYPSHVYLVLDHGLESGSGTPDWPVGFVGCVDSGKFYGSGVEPFLRIPNLGWEERSDTSVHPRRHGVRFWGQSWLSASHSTLEIELVDEILERSRSLQGEPRNREDVGIEPIELKLVEGGVGERYGIRAVFP